MHYAIPDYGVLTPTEMIDQARRMCVAVDIPLIFDADEFGGTVPGAYRSIRLFINAGAAGITWRTSRSPSTRRGAGTGVGRGDAGPDRRGGCRP